MRQIGRLHVRQREALNFAGGTPPFVTLLGSRDSTARGLMAPWAKTVRSLRSLRALWRSIENRTASQRSARPRTARL